MMEQEKLREVGERLREAETAIGEARRILHDLGFVEEARGLKPPKEGLTGASIIEGVFDGEAMVSTEGDRYPIPANYASKSKLVEGDRLKLTILPDGSFLYKQIGPTPRRNARGVVEIIGGEYRIAAEGHSCQVLRASITFHKLEAGDEVGVLLPDEREARFATIDQVLKRATDRQPLTLNP